jgi:hypothetical protein
MSPNRRIFLNIIATYGRSLYALVLGLFTARWALQALGVCDYGVMGVVGGLISSTGLTVFGIALDAPSDDPSDAPDLYQPPKNTPYTHPAYK